MKSKNLTIDQVSKLLDAKLKPIRSDLTGVKSDLAQIKETQQSHTVSLLDIENRVKPMAETMASLVLDHSKRIGDSEGRLDDIEPRVDALESVASK